MSIELTDAERAYLIGLYGRSGAEVVARHISDAQATGVLVDDLLTDDGPYGDEGKS